MEKLPASPPCISSLSGTASPRGFKDTWPLSGSDQESTLEYLQTEFICPTIDALAPHMRWFAKKSGLHIDALHNNGVKGRQIVVAEDPELHLVSHRKTIWIKPLPLWLLDTEFWDTYLPVANQDYSAMSARLHITGFIRTYTRLVRYESDFILAQERNLIQKDRMSFLDFQRLIKPFRYKRDDMVAQRYHYGQIRLSRLNWAIRCCQPSTRRYDGTLGRLYYHQIYWDLTDFVQASIAPLIVILGTVSVILSSMQVVLAVNDTPGDDWDAFLWTSWVFSVAVLTFLAVFVVALALIVAAVLFAQIVWGRGHNRLERSVTSA